MWVVESFDGCIRYSARFKTKVVREALRRDKTLQEIAARYDIHPTQAGAWVGRRLIFLSFYGDKQRNRDAERGITHERQ